MAASRAELSASARASRSAGCLRSGRRAGAIAPLPLRDQVLPFAGEGRQRCIALGAARRHLRQRGCRVRALRPLCGLERLIPQLGVRRTPLLGQPVGRLDEAEKVVVGLLRLAFLIARQWLA